VGDCCGSPRVTRHVELDGGEPSLNQDADVRHNPAGEAGSLPSLVIAFVHRDALDQDLVWMIVTDSVRAAARF